MSTYCLQLNIGSDCVVVRDTNVGSSRQARGFSTSEAPAVTCPPEAFPGAGGLWGEGVDSEWVSWGSKLLREILRQDAFAQEPQVGGGGEGAGGRKRAKKTAGITGWESGSDLILPVSIGDSLLSKPQFPQK